MASAPVTELETGLNQMQALKPPGVSGSRIQSLTTLCVENVQSESVLIQKIFTHFKKTPGTHKLGVLYVVDSVTRRWIDYAKQQGQQVNGAAQDGTFAAGVNRVTELLPVLMNDIIQNAPTEQKEKIKKLIDIWEKGQTFPLSMIESFKHKLSAPPAKNDSTTPTSTPPPGPGLPGLPNNSRAPAAEAPNAIMEALANIAKRNVTSGSVNQGGPSYPSGNSIAASTTPQPNQHIGAVGQAPSAAPSAVTIPGMPFPFPQLPQAHAQAAAQNQTPVPPSGPGAAALPLGFPGAASGAPPVSGADQSMQSVMLIKLLVDQGVPPDKIPAIVASLSGMQNNAAPGANAPPVSQSGQAPYPGTWGGQEGYQQPHTRGPSGYDQPRSPGRYQNRSRSRSPPRQWDSARGRDRDYTEYGRDSPGDRGHRGRGQDYRQRTPPRHGRSPSPESNGQNIKWVEYDRNLPQGSIKVLSRTLFVGGVTCSEGELRASFARYGKVQTCIVNKDKRHAFVKMVNRADAVSAKAGMESGPFRTRWGVGFGPRDCSDYGTGVSVIPINRLTEADRKWMLTAPYGGSGGRPIETGLVVEEPDIEIGAGVSSKAISRRMQTDKSGRHGPKSSRGGPEDDGDSGRWKRNRDNRRDERKENPTGGEVSTDFSAAGFPFGIGTGANGMPIFPPGFTFPAPPQ